MAYKWGLSGTLRRGMRQNLPKLGWMSSGMLIALTQPTSHAFDTKGDYAARKYSRSCEWGNRDQCLLPGVQECVQGDMMRAFCLAAPSYNDRFGPNRRDCFGTICGVLVDIK
jgi:hypothetical protein